MVLSLRGRRCRDDVGVLCVLLSECLDRCMIRSDCDVSLMKREIGLSFVVRGVIRRREERGMRANLFIYDSVGTTSALS